jgi:tripartite-type tricarboxylate transporter receptor subunit TctC
MATAGVGSVGHVLGVFFQKQTGTEFRFVPYRGLGPATQAVLAGQVDMLITAPSAALEQIRAGSMKGYAITDRERLATAPEIPTVDEAGVPGLYAPNWYALWAPKGTPQQAITKLNAATVTALAVPNVRKNLVAAGLNLYPRDEETPEALARLQKADIEKWWPVIKAADINLE